jgi:hypothetical protein
MLSLFGFLFGLCRRAIKIVTLSSKMLRDFINQRYLNMALIHSIRFGMHSSMFHVAIHRSELVASVWSMDTA